MKLTFFFFFFFFFNRQDPVAAVTRIAEFLGKELSKDLIVEIADKCSFKNLAAADEKLKQTPTVTLLDNPGEFGTSQMYRKGNNLDLPK